MAGKLEIFNAINEYILDLIPSDTILFQHVFTIVCYNFIINCSFFFIGDEKEYLSADSVDRSEADGNEAFDVLTPMFLNTLTTSGLPSHKIKLKTVTPIMLLRNIDQSEGWCNGIRLIVTRLANHVIVATFISGKNIGAIVYIPRMEISPTQSPWPFKLSRRQFPIIVCYVITINKSQGQSLDYVGLYLLQSVFSHGQLYVVISKVKSKKSF